MDIGSKGIAIVRNYVDPVLEGAVPRPSLEHRGNLSRAFTAGCREGALIVHIGIRISRGKFSIAGSSTNIISASRVGDAGHNILKNRSKVL